MRICHPPLGTGTAAAVVVVVEHWTVCPPDCFRCCWKMWKSLRTEMAVNWRRAGVVVVAVVPAEKSRCKKDIKRERERLVALR